MGKQSQLKRAKFPFKSRLNLLNINWWKIAVKFWKIVGIVASIGAVGLLVWIVVRDWQGLQANPNENSKRKLDGSLSIVTTGATIVTGLFLVLNYTAVQGKNKIDADFAEKRLTMERFTKAVEMLGSDSIHVRLGGIYSLESIARDSDPDKPDDDYQQVFEVLTAFIRENSPYPPKTEERKQENSSSSVQKLETTEEAVVTKNEPQSTPLLPTDIQAVLTVITRRKHKDTDWEDFKLDLRKSDLRKADLRETNLQAANLQEANLQEATLWSANLQEANLSNANLQGATLWSANLQEAILSNANLQKTMFWSANLQKANLANANLQEATLWRANLQGATLWSANLQEANLSNANLQKAMFWKLSINKFELLQGIESAKARLISARHWEAAKYDPEIRELLELPPKPANSEQSNISTVLERSINPANSEQPNPETE